MATNRGRKSRGACSTAKNQQSRNITTGASRSSRRLQSQAGLATEKEWDEVNVRVWDKDSGWIDGKAWVGSDGGE